MTDLRFRIDEKPDVLLDYIAITEHIERWTEDRDLADRTVDAIRLYIKGFCERPHRGTKRDDIRPRLRIVPFKKRTVIAFEVDEGRRVVTILRVFYGGQDYEAVIRGW